MASIFGTFLFNVFCFLVINSCFVLAISAQKIAVLTPEKTIQTEMFAENLKNSLSKELRILDNSLSETAFNSIEIETPFNLSTEESKTVGKSIGCEYFLLIKAANQRRASLEKNDFYESFAIIYVISSRTGRLVFWKLQKFEEEKQSKAENLLLNSTDNLAKEIYEKLKKNAIEELNEKPSNKIEEVPDENYLEAKKFRPPLPYKRLKPEYTSAAFIYQVTATVDIAVDLSETGEILTTEIVRWAGFGLDESVTEAVTKMKWRAAERNGKTLPMRVLLRYNFKKVEKE